MSNAHGSGWRFLRHRAQGTVHRLAWASSLALAAALPGQGEARNSTAKIRPKPSAMAARAGTAVEWREDLSQALTEARELGRPVFWYVPTVAGSPMDRKPEIDRYMMAGPFSAPDVIELLNAAFVPVKQAARGRVQKDYGLQPRAFIEPGFVVLDAAGDEQSRAHRITTLHAEWFLARLRPHAPAQLVPGPREMPEALRAAWQLVRDGGGTYVKDILSQSDSDWPPEWMAEVLWLLGAANYESGRHWVDPSAAQARWRELVEGFPDSPWAWKAAAEMEGHGPFTRGFEVLRNPPPEALVGTPSTRAPAQVYSETDLRKRGTEFLFAMRHQDGSYTDSTYDFGGTDGLPNVHAAVTAIVGQALLEELWRSRRDGEVTYPDPHLDALDAIRAHACDLDLLDLGPEGGVRINPADTDEIVWAHAYRAQFLARWLQLREGGRPEIEAGPGPNESARAGLQRAVDALVEQQLKAGGWSHEYANPFATATVLLALADARDAGIEFPTAVIDRGVASLLRCRNKSGAYSYGQTREGSTPRASVIAAAGRMPLCEAALTAWRPRPAEDLAEALKAAFDHHPLLEAIRKYDDHADRHGYGGFFFWYDVAGRVRAIEQVEDPAQRRALAERQRAAILEIPEFDGCFVDSHELGRVYGTASALWSLARLAEVLADG
ncbi:MAG: hypothetical protein AAF628_01745 [Planctomycetota bacterium]